MDNERVQFLGKVVEINPDNLIQYKGDDKAVRLALKEHLRKEFANGISFENNGSLYHVEISGDGLNKLTNNGNFEKFQVLYQLPELFKHAIVEQIEEPKKDRFSDRDIDFYWRMLNYFWYDGNLYDINWYIKEFRDARRMYSGHLDTRTPLKMKNPL